MNMYPFVSAEDTSMAYSQDIYDMFRNSNFTIISDDVINLIRKHQRPKVSALLPNPSYLSAFYQNIPPNNNINQNGIAQNLSLPPKKIKYQGDVSYSPVLNSNTSTSTSSSYQPPCYSDSYYSKTNLLQSITKIDSEIAEIEVELIERKKIEASQNKSTGKQLKQVSTQLVEYTLFKKIIAENQQKAHKAHSVLCNLGFQLDFPVYNQPCDTAVYHENKKHFILFKEKLKMFLRKKCMKRMKTQKALLRLYSDLNCKWISKINKVGTSQRNKSKEVKKRNYFETVFPELKKKKLTGERSKRTADHVLSEADYQEILHRLEFEDLQYTLLKSSSAQPPFLLDSEQRVKFFRNKNNLITDIKGTGEKDFLKLWTPTEKAIFKKKFIQCYKDFGKIASFLDKKNVADCVKYYYLTKKRENYKVSKKSKEMKHGTLKLKKFCGYNEKLQLLPTSNNSKEK